MRKALLFILLTISFSVLASEEWVLHYQKGSNWGMESVIWLNSNNNLVVSTGQYHQNIPCSSKLNNSSYLQINKIVQKLIKIDPRRSNNLNTSQCNDETRINIVIALKPGTFGSLKKGQRLLVENYSTWKVCNTEKIVPQWIKLTEALEAAAKTKLENCINTPFGIEKTHNK